MDTRMSAAASLNTAVAGVLGRMVCHTGRCLGNFSHGFGSSAVQRPIRLCDHLCTIGNEPVPSLQGSGHVRVDDQGLVLCLCCRDGGELELDHQCVYYGQYR